MDREPKLVSFVLRFVYEGAEGGVEDGTEDGAVNGAEEALAAGPDAGAGHPTAPGWHGVIRHVQSSAERHFVRWEEAMGFIGEYVELGKEDRHPPSLPS